MAAKKSFTSTEIISLLKIEITKHETHAKMLLSPPTSPQRVQDASQALFKAAGLEELVLFFRIAED